MESFDTKLLFINVVENISNDFLLYNQILYK